MSVQGIDSGVLMTASEAAEFLRISRRKLWQLKDEGDIPAVMIGRAVRYDRADLLDFVNRQKVSSGHQA